MGCPYHLFKIPWSAELDFICGQSLKRHKILDGRPDNLPTNERLSHLAFLKVHKIENFFDSDFGICVISLLVMSKY